jgi:hypothetical protein
VKSSGYAARIRAGAFAGVLLCCLACEISAPLAESAVAAAVSGRLAVMAYADCIEPAAPPAYPADGMAVPILLQADYQKTVCVYDGQPRSVASSGCGAVCLSMALIYLTGDITLAPDVIFLKACLNGYYKGNGLSCAALSEIMQSHGYSARWTGRFYDRISEALSAGYPVIACMGKGWFTGGGHYIVLRGLTKDGEVLVNDPGSKANSARSFEMRFIFRQAKGESPFMICMPPGAKRQ